MEKIFFKNHAGRRICGNLYENESDTAVLICHGLGSHKDTSPFDIFQRKINKLGLTVLSIDLTGHGETEGDYHDITLSRTIDDILSAKTFLYKKGYKKIGFVGHSFGAVGGIMAASIEEFNFLVLISPPTHYDVKEMVRSGIYVLRELRILNKTVQNKKKAKIKVNFFRDFGSHDSYEAAKTITSPTLVIQGDKDNIIPLEKTKELDKHLPNSKFFILKGAGHHFGNPDVRKKLVLEVMKFIKKII